MVNTAETLKADVELSIFDVKELYDRAYDMQADKALFRALLAEALKMDMAYRQNLKEKADFKSVAYKETTEETPKSLDTARLIESVKAA